MDNVLVDFESGINRISTVDLINYGPDNLDEVPGIFGLMDKVIYQQTFKGGTRDGERYWSFEIPQPEIKEYPIGSGFFDIDEYFITPEEERQNKIDQVLCLN